MYTKLQVSRKIPDYKLDIKIKGQKYWYNAVKQLYLVILHFTDILDLGLLQNLMSFSVFSFQSGI